MRAVRWLWRSPVLLGAVLGAAIAVLAARDKDAGPGQQAEFLTGAMLIFVPFGVVLGVLVRLGRRYRIVRRR